MIIILNILPSCNPIRPIQIWWSPRSSKQPKQENRKTGKQENRQCSVIFAKIVSEMFGNVGNFLYLCRVIECMSIMENKGFKVSQYACAVLLIVSSIALVAYQVIEIDDVATGLLYYVAQSFLLAGSIFGLDHYIKIISKRYKD